MSNVKLNLEKFRITRLNTPKNVIGGNIYNTTNVDTITVDPKDVTELDPPDQPLCINTSKEYIGTG